MKPEITSEYGPLRAVLVHRPGREHLQQIPWEGSHPLFSPKTPMVEELEHDHRQLRDALAAACGPENVFELTVLAEEMLETTEGPERRTRLREILGPRTDDYLAALSARGVALDRYPARELVQDIVCGFPRTLEPLAGALPPLILPPLRSLMWIRDSAFNTPCGIVISSMSASHRQAEPAMVGAVLHHHPLFADGEILLDLPALGRADCGAEPPPQDYLEGGNVAVLGEDCVAVGVGTAEFRYARKTTPSGFRRLAERLFTGGSARRVERIYRVHMPDFAGFIHLDTVFNLYGPSSAIAMPYVFGRPDPGSWSTEGLLREFVGWLRRGVPGDLPALPGDEHLASAGRVEVYEREHCRRVGGIESVPEPPRPFLDQLAGDGLIDLDRVTWVGGRPEDYPSPFEHLRAALYEQRNQAGNVFARGPLDVVAYHRNRRTLAELERHLTRTPRGGRLTLISSNELRTGGGGPRCLTMPLLRGPVA
jgi:arginine deiminase